MKYVSWVLVVMLAPVLFAGCVQYSDGERVGIVQKFSKKGFAMCKSYEGHAVIGLQNNGTINTNAEDFSFSVEEQSIIPALEKAMESGHRVKLHYNQEFIAGPCRSDTHYFVDKVTFLD